MGAECDSGYMGQREVMGYNCLQWVHQQGVQYMYMGQGVQLLTVGTWAGCPADIGYIRAGGPADFHASTYMYWASLHGSNHSTLHMRISSRRKSMATVPYYML